MIKGPIQTFLTILLGLSLFYLVRYFYFKSDLKVAQACPPITTKLANGNPFDLQTLKGKYVLIDFWGSWCKPCRQEAPLLNKFYSDWNQKTYQEANGFEILSIAIESNRANWEEAVAQDSAHWPYHILELDQFNSPLVKSFDVKMIPTKLLIDPHLRIVGINQSFEEMNEYLARKLQTN